VHDLRRLRYFLAVARERNFTRAAAQLHVAQPALSRQVRLLEQELGVELLHRTTHDVELTQAGEFLLERGAALLAGADELSRSVRSFGSGDRGAVVVAYGASASYDTAPRLLQALAERHPDIAVTTTVATSAEIAAGVRDGTFDLGLVRCPTDLTGLAARTVRRESQGVLCRRDHRLASGPTASITDLAGETLLLHPREANPGHYDAIVDLCRAEGVEPRVRLRTLSFDLAQTPVAGGEAVAIVGESSQHLGDLCWVRLDPPVTLDVVLVARLHPQPPAAGRLLDAAEAIAAELGWVMPNHAEPMP
jgi:DNA-binding transcriptional LysR family regulator